MDQIPKRDQAKPAVLDQVSKLRRNQAIVFCFTILLLPIAPRWPSCFFQCGMDHHFSPGFGNAFQQFFPRRQTICRAGQAETIEGKRLATRLSPVTTVGGAEGSEKGAGKEAPPSGTAGFSGTANEGDRLLPQNFA